ncbi:ATP-binding protein [Mesorhizobium sp. M2E.F.Ca.ET.219.01.1.1]|uniref:ATP-binding protein n=1 Tax=Mesorhizobium sp. M2E.F.Ca.ET.219.01.1.1 TaxID=2500530 RepID=UPI000FD6EFC3|nr:ATP-binding protein [Mesorhizobium sp. M2E.F.Ca.ET.219.01.1.1]TGQ04466.1 HAMP domain-containing protein [Mesorhizobium sp. M2E.F.Ca.ET.219.01.1.1]
MLSRLRRIPTTIRGQITIIILIALVTAITMGGALEHWAKKSYTGPDLEDMARKLDAIAELLRSASPDERQIILANVHRAGWEISLAPISTFDRFTHSSSVQSIADAMADWFFPPDNDPPPLGGWRTFLDDRRVIAVKIDDDTILLTSDFPNSLLTNALLARGPYYFVAFVVLIVFFFVFAIRAITEPIRRIADAATMSDVSIGSPIFEEKGTVEIVALARALNGMRRRIRQMIDARTRMLRGIGHDLRTPLTRMKLRVERMAESAEKNALLTDIDRIEKLLVESLSYLRNDYANEAPELVDVASILQTVCSEFSDVGAAVAYIGPNKLAARCRPLSVTRAVTNLCDNAAKFAHKVEVRLTEQPDMLIISVEDDGPGIPNELIERVVEPFYRADTSRSASPGGFGLGLSIVADIAHSHHGSLHLRQRFPHGLSALLTIPR